MREIAAEELLKHADFVNRVARGLYADEHRAQDLVQETWVTAMTRDAPRGAALRGWLAGVARNLARQGRRGDSRRAVREERTAKRERQPSTSDLVERMETHRRVVEAVLDLSAGAREVVLLHYFEGEPPRAIAARLGLPVETVRTRIKRAREKMRERLVERHGSHGAYLLAIGELARRGSPGTALAATGSVPALVKLTAACLTLAVAGVGVVAWAGGGAGTPPAAGGPLAVEVPLRAGDGAADDAGEDLAVAGPGGAGRTPRTVAATPRRASVSAAPDESTAAVHGTLTVVNTQGRRWDGASGSFQVSAQGDRAAAPITLADGRFPQEAFPEGAVRLHGFRLTGDGPPGFPAPLTLEHVHAVHVPGEPLLLTAQVVPRTPVTVLDAETGLPLGEVRVMHADAGAGSREHPGPHMQSEFFALDEPSPVLLPASRAVRSYWITARGYSWGFLKVDHASGGEREVRLTRAGRIAVQVVDLPPDLAVHARIYRRGSPDVAAACLLDQGGFQGFSGLVPGPYAVRAERGHMHEQREVLAEVEVLVRVGESVDARLAFQPPPAPDTVDISGVLVLPRGREDMEVSLLVTPADGPALRRYDRKRVPVEHMLTDGNHGNEREWRVDDVTPGHYVLLVSPFQYAVEVVVPEVDVEDLRIEIPPVHEVTVRVVDEETGRTPEQVTLRWTPGLPSGAQLDGWTYMSLGPDRERVTFLTPRGRIFLAANSPVHAQRFLDAEVGNHPPELVLKLQRLIPIPVVLRDAGTVLPWVPGMTCHVRPVGTNDLTPCGPDREGRLAAHVPGPGTYEIVIGPIDGYRTPAPQRVTVTGDEPPPLVVELER